MADNSQDPTAIGETAPDNKIRIDKGYFYAHTRHISGRELLELAEKKSPEDFAIYLKVKGGQPQRIARDEKVDLSRPGVERFLILPLDQTEGYQERREFALPKEDIDWLAGTQRRFELVAEAGVPHVVLYDFPIPLGYNRQAVDVNVRIESGYPDTQIDMVYVHPPLQRLDLVPIGATCLEGFDGKQWQRWSRHRTPANPWRPCVDNLSTHFALVEHWFLRELQKS